MFHLLLSSGSSASDASLKQKHMLKSQDHNTSSKSGKTNSRPKKREREEKGWGGGGMPKKKPLVLFSSRVSDCLLKSDSCSLQALCSPQCTQKRRVQRKQTKKQSFLRLSSLTPSVDR